MSKNKQKLNTTVQDISIDLLREPIEPIRYSVDEEKLDDLARSLKKIGIIQPLVVEKVNDVYEIIAGHRRYLAAKRAGLGTLPCVVIEVGHSRQDLMKWHENVYREEVNPIEQARWLVYLMQNYGYSQKDLVEVTGLSTGSISWRLLILEGDPLVREALEDGQISISQAKELNLVDDPEIRHSFLKLTIENGASVKTLQMWRFEAEGQKAYRSAKYDTIPQEEIAKAMKKPVTTDTYGGNGVSLFPVSQDPAVTGFTCIGCNEFHPWSNLYKIELCYSCYGLIREKLTITEEAPGGDRTY